ncbi:protein PAF1 homolog [Curcuma longa]|uniref:protein PAF1 homolog n=1 Tax=Curcuma longa TaxID=136217 RepID=UPI003D9FA988
MSSFRPHPPLPTPVGGPPPAPNQNRPFPPPLNLQFQPYPSQPHGGYPASVADAAGYGRNPPGSAPHPGFAGSFNLSANQQQYPYAPSMAQAPPPPSGAYPPPPPPQHSMYYPSSQYPPQYNPPSQPPPPPPPASPPPNPSIPPPPPPSIPPPPSLSSQVQSVPPALNLQRHSSAKVAPPPGRQQKPSLPPMQQKPSLPPMQQKPPPGPLAMRGPTQSGGPNGISARMETEEERRLRKKREYEKQKQEEKRLLFLKQSQSTVLQKTQMLTANARPNGSMTDSRMTDRRTTPFLGGDRTENRLKKPTTFICKMKFRNELPDPTAQPKLLAMNKDKDRFSRYTITSIEKTLKPKLYVEQDLGIPLDLLDMSIYNPHTVRLPLAHEDEELLHEEEVVTLIKQEGIRRKERPTDKGVSWLVKTQYISPISMEAAKMSISEKQAKEMRESREGKNAFLENLNNREKQIQAIEESFRTAKLPPFHQSKPGLEPVEILPLLPFFDRYEDQFVVVNFDGDPTADSEQYNKLDQSILDEIESQAIMKSYIVNGLDPNNPEKFLAYMAPAQDELYNDKKAENEDTTYTWLREYHWDVRGEDTDDPTTYLVSFGEKDARYLPLPTKLVLQKKAKEGRPGDEVEHFLAPSRVTVRKKSASAVAESNEYEETSGKNEKPDGVKRRRGTSLVYDDVLEEEEHKFQRTDDIDQLSGEEDLSD